MSKCTHFGNDWHGPRFKCVNNCVYCQCELNVSRIAELEKALEWQGACTKAALEVQDRIIPENANLREALRKAAGFMEDCYDMVNENWRKNHVTAVYTILDGTRQDMQAPGVENQGLNSEKLYKSPEPAATVQRCTHCGEHNVKADGLCFECFHKTRPAQASVQHFCDGCHQEYATYSNWYNHQCSNRK